MSNRFLNNDEFIIDGWALNTLCDFVRELEGGHVRLWDEQLEWAGEIENIIHHAKEIEELNK